MTQRQSNFDQPPKLPEDVITDGPDATSVGRYMGLLNRWFWKYYKQMQGGVPPPSGIGGHVIQDESVNLTQRLFLNFTGTGVTASDNSTTGATDVTIGSASTTWPYGNGADGSVHFDGTNTFSFASKTGSVYILLRSIYCTDCTIDAGVDVSPMDWATSNVGGGEQVFCTGTLTVNGALHNDGQNNNINKQIGGIGGGNAAGVNGFYSPASNGGQGTTGAGNPGGDLSNCYGGAGGAGGAGSGGNAGGLGGIVTAPPLAISGGVNAIYLPFAMQSGRTQSTGALFIRFFPGTGGGGGGGTVGVTGTGGGGGGGVLGVFARIIATGSGRISCNGGPSQAPLATAGSGGGGGGGLLLIITSTSNFASLVTCQANGGVGGAVSGGGVKGATGSNGIVASCII